MQVKSITLHNIGQFKELTIPLAPFNDNAPKVTVFIGNNGSGKTTVLKSLVTALNWLSARIRSERGRGLDIPEEVIMNGQSSGMVVLNVNVKNAEQSFTWQISKSKQGRKNQFSTDLKAINSLADIYRTNLTENAQADLPILAFYPVERSVLDIPLKIREKHSFEQINGYDNALNMGVDFRRFFEWFRNEEDAENEIYKDIPKLPPELVNILRQHNIDRAVLEKVKDNLPQAENRLKNETKLAYVKQAIQEFTGFEEIHIQRKPKQKMLVRKNNQEFDVIQLSQGEKSLMALVGDIARRLAMLNPSLENPLNSQGIVIIDEADLHLHPQWQRQLIARLTKTFPNCQFVLSTHSPLVISDSKDIVVYSLENGEMQQIPSQYGQDANTVLLNAMETAIRNEEVTQKLNNLLDLIQYNQLDDAKVKLTELHQELPENNLELAKAQLLLKKQEIRHEKNSKNS